MKTFDEMIKSRYPFYNPDMKLWKDVELGSDQVKELMREACEQAIDMAVQEIKLKSTDYGQLGLADKIANLKKELK